jgi:hypothetical protein
MYQASDLGHWNSLETGTPNRCFTSPPLARQERIRMAFHSHRRYPFAPAELRTLGILQKAPADAAKSPILPSPCQDCAKTFTVN